MSIVSSYMFVSNYNEKAIDQIRHKLNEMWNERYDTEHDTEEFPFNKPDLKETGGKACQFGNLYFCAFNLWDDTKFQNWLSLQTFEHIQVFFCGEYDEEMRQIYPMMNKELLR